jgi:hypothetical protein
VVCSVTRTLYCGMVSNLACFRYKYLLWSICTDTISADLYPFSDSSSPVNPAPVVNSLEMDLFGSDPISSLALVSVPQPTTTSNVEPPANSGFETNNFMGMPPTSSGFGEVCA